MTRIFKIGSPVEYLLGFQTLGIGLLESANNHLLYIENVKDRQQFAGILKRVSDVCPNILPLKACLDHGIDDVHHMRPKASTKPISIPPYQ